MKTYMPKGRQCRIFYKISISISISISIKGIPKNQPCAKLPEKLYSKNDFFQNGSITCSRGPDRYYEQFAGSIALRSFF